MKSVALAVLIFTSIGAFGHARWALSGGPIVPRNTSTGLKTSPCGGVARTSTPAVFTAGQTITVKWEETIDHPGFFRISFSPAGDANWVVLKDNITDTQNGGALPHTYTQQITLPNQACTDCTLQLIQVMTENPASPSYYYSCADIKLNATGSPPPSPPPAPSPAPGCP